jgi:DMSO/TMAO reductase YedYZ heme-binding membrane subunit
MGNGDAMPVVINLNQNVWWYFARAGGLVAWGLLAATVFWGLIHAGRLTRKKPTPAWNLDLHRFLGGLSVIFVAIHIGALMADRYVNFGVEQVLVPFATHWRPGAIAWGITAMYLVLAVEVTSLATRWLPRKLWRKIHMLSFLLFTVSTVHAIQSGTDTAKPWVQGIGIVLLSTAAMTLVLRIVEGRRKAVARAGRQTAVAAPVHAVDTAPAAPAVSKPCSDLGVIEPMDWSSIRPLPRCEPVHVPVARFTPAVPWPAAARAGEDRFRYTHDLAIHPTARPVPSGNGSIDRGRPGDPNGGRQRLRPRRPYALVTPRRDGATLPPLGGRAATESGMGGWDPVPSPTLHESRVAGDSVPGRAPWPPPGRTPKVPRFAEPPVAAPPKSVIRDQGR